MLQTPDGSDYVKTDEETKEGYIGNYTAAEAKTYEGFHSLSFQNILITPTTTESNTVIEIKYDRNFYNLSFITGDKGSYVPSVSVRYGQNLGTIVNDIDEPTRLGYQFIGWSLTNNGEVIDGNVTMPANQTSLYAVWSENTNASYTVVYWLESLTNPGEYDYITSKTGRGNVGNIIQTTGPLRITDIDWNNANIDPNGVERDTTKDKDVSITSDGQAVKNVYYNRKTFHIYFHAVRYEGGWIGGEYVDDGEIENLRITAKYGEDISNKWNDQNHSQYEWNTTPGGKTSYTLLANMGAEDITVYQAEKGTGTIITYYIESLDGQREEYQVLTAAEGVSLTDEDKTPIDGFTWNDWKQYTNGWFDNQLWLYYTRNSYTVSFENCTGVGDATLKYEQTLENAKPNDQSVQRPATVDEDEVFAGWYTSPEFEEGTEVNWNSRMPSHNVQLYAKWELPSYTVSFDTNGAGTYDPITVQKYESIEGKLPTPTKEGDEFLGWYTDEDFNYPFIEETNIVENLTLYAKWKNASIVPYTIRYIDAETKESIAEDTIGSAELNSYVLVEPKEVEGYTANSGLSQEILTHSDQIFEVEYTKKPTWSFTIRYLDIETQQPIIADSIQSVPDTTSQVVVQSPSAAEQEALKEYMIVSEPQITVTKDQDKGTVVFYYTKQSQTYTVNHQLQMPDGSYQTVETETLSANIGNYVTANPKSYEGYNCISTQYQRSGVVTSHAENERGLVINVKYNRTNPITVDNYTDYYDGESHGLTINGTLIKNDLVTETIEYSENGQDWSTTAVTKKDVSTGASLDYTVYVRFVTTVKDNTYTSEPEQHSITINPRPVTIKAPDANKVYDGTPLNTWGQQADIIQSEEPLSLGFVGEEGFITYYYTGESTITAPGEEDNVINESTTEVDSNLKAGTLLRNYDISYSTGLLKVTELPDTEKFIATIQPHGREVTYNGKVQDSIGIDSTTFAKADGTSLQGYTISAANDAFKGSGTEAGNYDVTQQKDIIIYDSENNNVTDQFKLNILPAQLVIKQREITVNAASYTWDYDGDEHSLEKWSVTVGTVADNQNLSATVKADTATGTIKEQGESADNIISNIVIRDASGADVTTNYDITPVNGVIRINPIDAEITAKIVIADKTTMYNGTIQKFSNLNGDDYTLSFEFKNEEDKIDTTGWHLINDEISTQGLYATTTAIPAVFANPTNLKVVDENGDVVATAIPSVTQGSLTINKAPLTITAGSDSKEYDGTPLTSSAFSQNGLMNSDKISLTTNGSQLKPGSSKNTVVEESVVILNQSIENGVNVTESYDIEFKTGILTVTNNDKNSRKITITAGDALKVYDGTPLTQATFRIEGSTVGNDTINRGNIKTVGSITTVGEEDNEVDPSTVQIMNGNVDVTEAYTIEYKPGTLEITQRPITLTGATDTHVYDGNWFANSTVTQTGTLANGDAFASPAIATGTIKDVDSKPNPVGEVKIINNGEDRTFCYDITYVPGTLTVTPADASLNAVTINSKTVTYNGQSQKLDNATSLVTNGTTLYYKEHSQGEDTWSTTMPEFKNVGQYIIDVKAVNDNYNDATASATLTIQQRPVVITGNSDEFTYNGEEQKVEGYTWTKEAENSGLLNSDTIENVEAIAKSVNVGKNIPGTITASKNVKITSNGEDVTQNYYITTTPGTITIDPKAISITSDSAEQKYNGQALIKKSVESDPELVKESQTINYNFTGRQIAIGTSKNTFTASIKDGENDVTRNYNITYNYGTLTVYGEINYNANGGTGSAPEADRYDAGDTYNVKENMFTRAGYTFGSWNTQADGKGTTYAKGSQITSLQNNVTLYAQWIANSDTQYNVATYLEGEDGNYPDKPTTSITRSAETDTTVSVTDADKQAPEGYALDPNADNVFDGTVAGDGSLVLKLYFAKDVIGENPEDPGDHIPDKYQILFTYVAKENGVVTGETYELHTFTDEDGNYVEPTPIVPEADVVATPDAGYHIDKWVDESSTELGNGTAPEFDNTTYTTNQTFTVSFAELESVTIHYEAKDGGSVTNAEDVINPEIGTPEGSKAVCNDGYEFDGWYLNDEKISSDLEFVPTKNAEGRYEEATYVAVFKKKEIPADPDKKDDDTNTSTETNMNAYMTMLIGSGLLGSLLLILRKKREQE